MWQRAPFQIQEHLHSAFVSNFFELDEIIELNELIYNLMDVNFMTSIMLLDVMLHDSNASYENIDLY